MKIGIYPGSFDPIHLGHIKIVNKILQDKIVDKVLIVPTGNYWNKSICASLKDRINMAKFFETGNIKVESKDNEIKATYDFLRIKQTEYVGDELYLILGGDNIANIEKWINFVGLITYPFIVVGRDEHDRTYIENKFSSINKHNYTILNIENIDISSTAIRESIKTNTLLERVLDKRVYDYIILNNLYK